MAVSQLPRAELILREENVVAVPLDQLLALSIIFKFHFPLDFPQAQGKHGAFETEAMQIAPP